MPFDDQNLFPPEEDLDSSNSDEPEKKKKKKNAAKAKTKSKKRSRAPLTKEEKESKRKANRINSRKFRLRQRQKIENLEKEVKILKEQNRQLQLGVHLARRKSEGADNDDKMELDDMKIDAASGHVEIPSPSLPVSALRQSHIRDLGDLILMKRQNKETTEKIKNIVKEHVEYFSDAGRTRKRLLKYHVSMLKKLLLPTQVTKLCVWGLQQDDEFFEDNKQSSEDEAGKPFVLDQESEEPSLWQIICDRLNLTDEQKAGIMENRKHVGAQRRNISEAMKWMAKVESKIEDTLKMNYNTLQSIMGVLTPLQQAKYLVWQEDNAACMQMLEHLWRSMV